MPSGARAALSGCDEVSLGGAEFAGGEVGGDEKTGSGGAPGRSDSGRSVVESMRLERVVESPPPRMLRHTRRVKLIFEARQPPAI